MPTRELDEDTIDLQDLQAQIDLSMSFAQNLVTSWVKPTRSAQPARQQDLENELKEYMRRPARLGVGTPIPDTQSLVRGATKLKYKLEEGKERQREEVVEMKKLQSEDEEESRTGAIKRKARVDLFDVSSRKKKKSKVVIGNNRPAIHPAAMEAISQMQSDAIVTHTLGVEDVATGLLSTSEPPEVPKKKREKHKPDANHNEGAQQHGVVSSPRIELLANNGNSAQIPISSEPLKLLEGPAMPVLIAQSLPIPPTAHPKVVNISPTTTPLLSPSRYTTDPGLLEQPLLNLDGLPSEGESDEDEKPEPPAPIPKKKRKRRKKKKKQDTETVSKREVIPSYS